VKRDIKKTGGPWSRRDYHRPSSIKGDSEKTQRKTESRRIGGEGTNFLRRHLDRKIEKGGVPRSFPSRVTVLHPGRAKEKNFWGGGTQGGNLSVRSKIRELARRQGESQEMLTVVLPGSRKACARVKLRGTGQKGEGKPIGSELEALRQECSWGLEKERKGLELWRFPKDTSKAVEIQRPTDETFKGGEGGTGNKGWGEGSFQMKMRWRTKNGTPNGGASLLALVRWLYYH